MLSLPPRVKRDRFERLWSDFRIDWLPTPWVALEWALARLWVGFLMVWCIRRIGDFSSLWPGVFQRTNWFRLITVTVACAVKC